MFLKQYLTESFQIGNFAVMGIVAQHIVSGFNSFTQSREELEKIVADAPASAFAKLLLLKKNVEEGNLDNEELLQHLALQTYNPHWLSLINEFIRTPHERTTAAWESQFVTPPSDSQPESQEPSKQDAGNQLDQLMEEILKDDKSSVPPQPVTAHAVENNISETGDFESELAEKGEEKESPVESDENKIGLSVFESEKHDAGNDANAQGGNTIINLDEFRGVTAPEPESPIFEPLHTVDYFASQGIRLKAEDIGDDKLGRQLKSFTGWLKSMKKLYPEKMATQDEAVERIIRASAENSNIDADVVTEAMAEVLVKQDKREKAIEMYEKLKLTDPSKSAYFAAKIESLKQ